MAYTKKHLRLRWPADGEYAGLVVVMRAASLGVLLRLQSLTSELQGPASEEAGLAAIGELVDALTASLVSWELFEEDADGAERPVPATREGVEGLDVALTMEIVRAWMEAAKATVPAPLESGPGVLARVPMEPLPS